MSIVIEGPFLFWELDRRVLPRENAREGWTTVHTGVGEGVVTAGVRDGGDA